MMKASGRVYRKSGSSDCAIECNYKTKEIVFYKYQLYLSKICAS